MGAGYDPHSARVFAPCVRQEITDLEGEARLGPLLHLRHGSTSVNVPAVAGGLLLGDLGVSGLWWVDDQVRDVQLNVPSQDVPQQREGARLVDEVEDGWIARDAAEEPEGATLRAG